MSVVAPKEGISWSIVGIRHSSIIATDNDMEGSMYCLEKLSVSLENICAVSKRVRVQLVVDA